MRSDLAVRIDHTGRGSGELAVRKEWPRPNDFQPDETL